MCFDMRERKEQQAGLKEERLECVCEEPGTIIPLSCPTPGRVPLLSRRGLCSWLLSAITVLFCWRTLWWFRDTMTIVGVFKGISSNSVSATPLSLVLQL